MDYVFRNYSSVETNMNFRISSYEWILVMVAGLYINFIWLLKQGGKKEKKLRVQWEINFFLPMNHFMLLGMQRVLAQFKFMYFMQKLS